jgi:trk system potassium uptake protein
MQLGKREGYLIVTLGWLTMAIFGSIPFIIYGSYSKLHRCFFETMSGLHNRSHNSYLISKQCLTVYFSGEALLNGLAEWELLFCHSQYSPLLRNRRNAAFSQRKFPAVTKDKFHPRIKETAKRLWGIYVILTTAETLLLMLEG